MYAVFCLAGEHYFPVDAQTIYLFDTEDEAEQFVWNQFCSMGIAKQDGDRFFAGDIECENREVAIWSCQMEHLGPSDFLHVYEVRDKRKWKSNTTCPQ